MTDHIENAQQVPAQRNYIPLSLENAQWENQRSVVKTEALKKVEEIEKSSNQYAAGVLVMSTISGVLAGLSLGWTAGMIAAVGSFLVIACCSNKLVRIAFEEGKAYSAAAQALDSPCFQAYLKNQSKNLLLETLVSLHKEYMLCQTEPESPLPLNLNPSQQRRVQGS